MNQEFIPFENDNEYESTSYSFEPDLTSDLDTGALEETREDNTKDVKRMIQYKKIMERHACRWDTNDYNDIMTSVNTYLLQYCNHNEITDLFDITPERSMMITYCDKCECTLRK